MKLLKLIKSEFVKLFSKKTTYLLIFIAAIIPVLPIIFEKLDEKDNIENNLVNNTFMIEQSKKTLDLIDKKDEKLYSMIKFIVDNKIEQNNIKITENWQVNLMYEYQSYKDILTVISLLEKGYSRSDIENVEQYLYYFTTTSEIFDIYENKREFNKYKQELEAKIRKLI